VFFIRKRRILKWNFSNFYDIQDYERTRFLFEKVTIDHYGASYLSEG